MTLQIIDCDQGSPEWFTARLGIPTASEFKTLLGIKKDARDKVTRTTYMNKLAGELLTGVPAESYTNGHMERGKEMEDEARSFYAFMRDAEPQRVGFIRSGNAGCSPDSLIGDKGVLEIKTALPHILIDRIRKDDFPPEHKAQCQGALWVAEREWIDFVSYWPGLEPYIERVYRDEVKIKSIELGVAMFLNEMAEVMAKLEAA
jgi:hypothetical protein